MIDKATFLVPLFVSIVHGVINVSYITLFGFNRGVHFYNVIGDITAYIYHLVYYLVVTLISRRLGYSLARVTMIFAGAILMGRLFLLLFFDAKMDGHEFPTLFAIASTSIPVFDRLFRRV